MAVNLFDQLSPKAKFFSALLTNAGFNVEELVTKADANALKLHIEGLKTNPDLEKAINDATAQLRTDLTNAEAKVTEAGAKYDGLTSALATAGVKLGKEVETDGKIDGAKLKLSHELAVATAARNMVAKAGHPGLLDDPALDPANQKRADEKKKDGPEPTGRDRLVASFQREIAASAKRRN